MNNKMDNIFCGFCQREIFMTPKVAFSCFHSFCVECFPYILIDSLRFSGLSSKFFEEESELSCPLCQKGTAKKPFQDLIAKYVTPEAQVPLLCERCGEKSADKFCLDCGRQFCAPCLKIIHTGAKKFETHRTKELGLGDQPQKKSRCLCPEKETLSYFCQKCQISFCRFCSESEHKGHEKINIETNQLLLDNAEIVYVTQKKLNSFLKEYGGFQREIIASFQEYVVFARSTFTQTFETLIDEISKLKAEYETALDLEFHRFSSELSLVQVCVANLADSLKKNRELHPNQRYFLHRFLRLLEKKELELQKAYKPTENPCQTALSQFCLDFTRFSTEIKSDIASIRKNFYNIFEMRLSKPPAPFRLQNPVQLLQNEGVLLEERSFDFYEIKSGLCVFFHSLEDSYLAWAGCRIHQDLKTYPLIIYSLFKEERQLVLEEKNESEISHVGIFPNDEDQKIRPKNAKQWLYFANKASSIRIYEIGAAEAEILVKLDSFIETKVKIPIVSTAIFEDRFGEVPNGGNDCRTFMFVGFDSNLPLILYIRDEESHEKYEKWRIYKIIDNPAQQPCRVMGLISDELSRKIIFFLAFSKSYIRNYDLQELEFGNVKFETQTDVSSLNLMVENDATKSEILLIYSQTTNPKIIIGNALTGEVLRKIVLKMTSGVYDCIVWRAKGRNYLIIAKCNHNATVVLDLSDLQVVFEKKHEKLPRNYLRVVSRFSEQAELSEGLVGFMSHGIQSEILLYY